jgi:hypothetical protein
MLGLISFLLTFVVLIGSMIVFCLFLDGDNLMKITLGAHGANLASTRLT